MVNNNVTELLLKSGWFIDRNINIAEMEKYLNENGYVLYEPVKEFLKEFGLLKITFENPKNKKYLSTIEVDPKILGIYNSIFNSIISSYGIHCRKKMVPVARLSQHSMTICISEDGKFYGGYDEWLLELGDDFYELLENLTTGVKITPVKVEFDE